MQQTKKVRAGIVGAAGYTGGELIRLLLRHPIAQIVFAQSRSSAGKPVSNIHQDLFGETDLQFSSDVNWNVDVIFLCSGHGEAKAFLAANDVPKGVMLIDLSHDFRLAANAVQGKRSFVYGLPELSKANIQQAENIANPGCFATAIQLGLLPLAAAGILGEVHTTGITGSTGAGQSLSPTSHFSWRADNIQAYKTLQHQHVAEIRQSLRSFASDQTPEVHFVPWRGDFTRGIYVTSIVDCSLSYEEALKLFRDFYADAVFTHVSSETIDLKRVVNTNKCLISLEKQGAKLAIHSAIDNLLKGASGQAVQNMNLIFGLAEDAGLNLKASAF
jgi:N-acetyl-gamma-glutamyl-phosphate reductase